VVSHHVYVLQHNTNSENMLAFDLLIHNATTGCVRELTCGRYIASGTVNTTAQLIYIYIIRCTSQYGHARNYAVIPVDLYYWYQKFYR
jgi:hypothetical protein